MDDGYEAFGTADPRCDHELHCENSAGTSFPIWEARRPIEDAEARLVAASIAGTSAGLEK